MNEFTEVYRRKVKSTARLSRRHEWEVAQALTFRDRQRFLGAAGRLLIAALALFGLGYFLATASLTAMLVAGGLLLALLGALIVFGLYVLNNVR